MTFDAGRQGGGESPIERDIPNSFKTRQEQVFKNTEESSLPEPLNTQRNFKLPERVAYKLVNQMDWYNGLDDGMKSKFNILQSILTGASKNTIRSKLKTNQSGNQISIQNAKFNLRVEEIDTQFATLDSQVVSNICKSYGFDKANILSMNNGKFNCERFLYMMIYRYIVMENSFKKGTEPSIIINFGPNTVGINITAEMKP